MSSAVRGGISVHGEHAQGRPGDEAPQERYSDDRERLSKEMMGLYRKKASIRGGCFPLLLQMPVFLALYWVLYEAVELRRAPFMLWINDGRP